MPISSAVIELFAITAESEYVRESAGPTSGTRRAPCAGMPTRSQFLHLHMLALVRLQAGNYRAARSVIAEIVLALPPEHAALSGLLTTLAFVQQELGQTYRAAEVARQALVYGPDNAVAREILARILRQEVGT